MGLIEAKKRILMNEPHLVTTTTAGIATFNTDMKASLKSCIVNFEPVQEGSGDPSPDNIRPITGWTGLNVYKGGKNLLNPSLKVYSSARDIQKWGMSNSNVVDNSIILPKGSYTLSISNNESAPTEWKVIDSLGNLILHKYGSSNFNSFTLDKQTAIGIYMSIKRSETNLQALHNYVMLEAGSTATNFEPYIAVTTYPISWESTNGTLYGGELDLISGVISVKYVKQYMKELTWYNYSGYTLFYIAFSNKDTYSSYLICDSFKYINRQPNSEDEDQIIGATGNGKNSSKNIYFLKTGMTSNNDFNTWLQELEINPYFIYKLNTPIYYQLTPQQITTLVNINNIWSNINGDIITQYWTH